MKTILSLSLLCLLLSSCGIFNNAQVNTKYGNVKVDSSGKVTINPFLNVILFDSAIHKLQDRPAARGLESSQFGSGLRLTYTQERGRFTMYAEALRDIPAIETGSVGSFAVTIQVKGRHSTYDGSKFLPSPYFDAPVSTFPMKAVVDNLGTSGIGICDATTVDNFYGSKTAERDSNSYIFLCQYGAGFTNITLKKGHIYQLFYFHYDARVIPDGSFTVLTESRRETAPAVEPLQITLVPYLSMTEDRLPYNQAVME